jgi:hypothetical protein
MNATATMTDSQAVNLALEIRDVRAEVKAFEEMLPRSEARAAVNPEKYGKRLEERKAEVRVKREWLADAEVRLAAHPRKVRL